ncbi:MAG: putative salt-induced outer membrane protein [Candidatus Azotimanducaceae bacterium]|jgi:putative salt-induced outer membrane protein
MHNKVAILAPEKLEQSMNRIVTGAIALVALLVITHPASAASEDSIWASEVEVGAFYSTGNTDETNIKVRGEAVRDGEVYVNTYKLDLLNNSTDGTKTAQKTYGVFQLDRKLSDISSIFGRAAYEDDKFSGFDYQVDFTVGYSREFLNSDIHQLKGSAGFGYRQSELPSGMSEDEAIVRLAADYVWQVSDSATFKQGLSTQIGDVATISRSETSLSADVLDNVALKVALYIKNTSEVPVGTDKTDTETALTLLYKF